jgi:hypothetical protein
MEILNKIQKELKAPKNQKNNFGNYNYRSCEDILEAVKPFLGTTILTLTDEIVLVGDRYYVKAIVTITDKDKSISVSAYARESLDKKGMDTAQITGAASSYARKYALNGLFCIDDTKDADVTNNSNGNENNNIPITKEQMNVMLDWIANLEASIPKFLEYMKLDKLENMLQSDYPKAIAALEAKNKQKNGKK